jgi:hypothetical protein
MYSGHQVTEGEMGGAYGTNGKKRNHTRFWWGNLNVRTSLKNWAYWKGTIKLDHKETCSVDRINLAQDRDMWRTLANTVTEFRIL